MSAHRGEKMHSLFLMRSLSQTESRNLGSSTVRDGASVRCRDHSSVQPSVQLTEHCPRSVPSGTG